MFRVGKLFTLDAATTAMILNNTSYASLKTVKERYAAVAVSLYERVYMSELVNTVPIDRP